MRDMKNLVMVGLVLAVGAMTVQATPIIDQDFDGLTLGDYGVGDEASLGPARYVTGTIAVVDDGPFAGAGNQSMRISDGASGDGRIQYRGANPGLSSGVVSLDFNVVTGMFIINAVDDYDTGAYIEIVADLRPGKLPFAMLRTMVLTSISIRLLPRIQIIHWLSISTPAVTHSVQH